VIILIMIVAVVR